MCLFFKCLLIRSHRFYCLGGRIRNKTISHKLRQANPFLVKFISHSFFIINFIGILSILLSNLNVSAQAQQPIILRALISNGDTIPMIDLPAVVVFSPLEFKNKREAEKFGKLVRHIKKVYPYAKLSGDKLQEYNEILLDAKSERERRKIMQKAEEELKAQFEDDLKKLTFTQGKILLKLVDRETSYATYELVKELRGNIMAAFWQGFARLFGYNLKDRYNPNGEDKDIERIVQMIEAGWL